MLSATPSQILFEITINDIVVEGLLQASIYSNNSFAADSFALTFAVGSLPLGDSAFWSSLTCGYVEVGATTRYMSSPTTIVTGMIDTVGIDLVNGTASIEGRDLSASLVDAFQQQDFVNQSASDIVATIAQNHGLGASVVPTLGYVGRYYADDYTRLSLGQFSRLRSDWDLVVQLARENTYDAFVTGRILNFTPVSNEFTDIYFIDKCNVSAMRIDRTLAIGNVPVIRMQSWNSQNVASYISNGVTSINSSDEASSTSAVQSYLFSGSNLTSQQVDQAATRYGAEISRLQRILTIQMPWDLVLTPRTAVCLATKASVLDGLYRIESIDRHYSVNAKSHQHLRASYVQL